MRAGATHCPPSSSSSPSRSPSPHPPSATASPSSSPHPSRPLPHLHLHSCPRTRTLTLTSLHCARADVGYSARVWARLVSSATPLRRVPIGRGCSAREGVIWSAGPVAPRCGSATLVDLRAEGLSRRLRRRVPVNPGRRAGNSARETAAGRAVRAAPPSIARRASLPSQSSIRESDLCSLTLSAAPAPHTESLSALQTPTLSFTVLSVESEWSAPSLK